MPASGDTIINADTEICRLLKDVGQKLRGEKWDGMILDAELGAISEKKG